MSEVNIGHLWIQTAVFYIFTSYIPFQCLSIESIEMMERQINAKNKQITCSLHWTVYVLAPCNVQFKWKIGTERLES